VKPKRHIRKKAVFEFANGAAGPGLVQSQELCLEGELLHIQQRNSDNTNNVTAQLTLEDVDGFEIFDGTAKPDNTVHNHEFGVAIRRILTGKNPLKCTISGNPGASGYTVTVVVHLYGRDG
jgi:hypothetical protein